jgi:hypothetical protein
MTVDVPVVFPSIDPSCRNFAVAFGLLFPPFRPVFDGRFPTDDDSDDKRLEESNLIPSERKIVCAIVTVFRFGGVTGCVRNEVIPIWFRGDLGARL